MKIGILTFNRALNYGAMLQMYALQNAIKRLGIDAEVVDYRSPYIEQQRPFLTLKSSAVLSDIARVIFYHKKRATFQKFINKNIHLSDEKYTPANISSAAEKFDFFIAGSDQIWNTNLTQMDMNYFLVFANGFQRYSYAASIGMLDFPKEGKTQIVDALRNFRYISVREKSAQELIENEVQHVKCICSLDPTLLLTKDEWSLLTACVRPEKEKYIMVFSVEKSLTLIEEVVRYARNKSLKVLYVGPYVKTNLVTYIPAPTVERLLALFMNSECVFTNSFHGTVFSIVFHKKFYSRIELEKGRNARVTDLLESLGLSNRLNLMNIESEVDWVYVDEQIAAKRKESISYLQRVIEENEQSKK